MVQKLLPPVGNTEQRIVYRIHVLYFEALLMYIKVKMRIVDYAIIFNSFYLVKRAP